MNEKCSYDAIVDLSALNLDDFIQDNISEAVEQMEKAQKDGDFSYICERIQCTVRGLKKTVAAGQKDSAAKTVKALHNAVLFIDWGIKHHVIEMQDSEGKILPWIAEVLSLLNFMSACHTGQEALTAQQVQQLYDMAGLFRKFEELTGIKFEVSERLQPPQQDGEGVHVRLIKKNGKLTSCSEAEYFKYRIASLSKQNSLASLIVKAFCYLVVGTALCFGTALLLEKCDPGRDLDILKILSPCVGAGLALVNFLWNLYASKTTSKYYQGMLADIYREWCDSPTHGTEKPLDSDFTKITGVSCGFNDQFILSNK
ncbi:MAG: hypothetical protein Q4F00_08260 [bacterium]|nr:hypothetical protein [bacterium]